MSISLKELLKSTNFSSIPKAHQGNLMDLLEKINKLREAYGKAMVVTSGYRSMADHLRIYKAKGVTDQSKIPMKSKHLSGQAVDISDPGKNLQKWIIMNIDKLEEIGLWCEDFEYTKTWCHFQITPPNSGKRFFIP